jgi:hypothetical protein
VSSARTWFRIYVSRELRFILLVLLTIIFHPDVTLYYTAAFCCTVYCELALSLLTVPVQLCWCIKIHTSKAFVSSYYSNSTCFGQTGHYQVSYPV